MAVIWAIEIILRKKLSHDAKASSALSKIGGVTLGLLEGILIISILIMAVEFYPTPKGAKYPFEGAVSYKAIKQVAPSIKDFTVKPVSVLKDMSDGKEPEELEEE